jgi:TonB family protein
MEPKAVSAVQRPGFRRRLAQVFALVFALGLALAVAGSAQAPDPAAPTAPQADPQAAAPAAAPQPAQPAQAEPAPTPEAANQPEATSPADQVTEDELKHLLVGKELFLRGGYLGDSISFNEHGDPAGHPAAGSYTLSAVEIDKVHISKHKVELDGARYGLHFLGALPYEDPDKAVDRVKITPKKKVLRITIDREQVIKPRKAKEAREKNKKSDNSAPAGAQATEPVASSETDVATPAQPAAAAGGKAEAAEAAADQPAEEASVTTTVSPAHAAMVLHQALDKIFAPGLDDKVRAQMPEFWQLYYQAQATGVDFRPRDPNVLRPSAVDSQAKVLTSLAPDSNEYAQASGIAGRALYRAVIGADGKPTQIAVVRPIGFGLDENAVAAIRKATFQPAVKGGQPVAETLDLAVLFRIYSKRTSVVAAKDKPDEPVKAGPFTIQAERQNEQNQPPENQPDAKPDIQPPNPSPAPAPNPPSSNP